MLNIEDQKKINLLQQYVLTLERQNFAKNGETTLLYEQLKSMQEENEMLKSFIEKMKAKYEEETKDLSERLAATNEVELIESRNFVQQLRNSVDIGSLKAVAEDMRFQLETKQTQLSQLTQKNHQLQSELCRLKQELTEITYKAMKSQEKLRNQFQISKQLENQIYTLKNSRIQNKSGVSFAKLEVQKLVRQNNQLIQKIRVLQKQKNGYYHQLKMASPLKIRPPNNRENKSANKKGQGKWSVMEEKLKAIRNQNEQLKANLAII